MARETMKEIEKAITLLQSALKEEVKQEIADRVTTASSLEDMVSNTPSDISARYWLNEFLDPLSRAEMKSIVQNFLVPLMNDEQAKMLIKFLMTRFPSYYQQDMSSKKEAPQTQEKPLLADQAVSKKQKV